MASFRDVLDLARGFATNSALSDAAWQELNASVPDHVTLEEMLAGLEDSGDTNPRAALLAVLACLKGKTEIGPRDEASVRGLCDYVATAIAPCWACEKDADGEPAEPPEYDDLARRSRETSPYGLEILRILANDDHPPRFSDAVRLTLISAAHPSAPWTTEATRDLATSLLGRPRSADDARPDELLVEVVLKSYLRPLFSRARPDTVTPSGRKAAFQDEHDPRRGLSAETPAVKPWKYLDHRAIPVFHYTVQEAEEPLISKQWPLFIPVILTLLDDTTTRVRAHGLAILNDFLSKFPNHILRDTGLSSVFEDAVFPTLHFLPNITPEAESIELLVPAYSALLTLAGKVDGKAQTGKYPSDAPRAKLLDKILREGVFSAYFHAKEHIRIVEVLLVQTARVLDEMGIHGVKHLKDLIPMHSEIMTNPFAALAPSTLLAAIKSLQATISNCWPRLSTPAYQSELIKALVVCFLTVQDDQDKLGTQFPAVEAGLIKTAAMLSAVARTGGGEGEQGTSLQDKVAPLIAKEPLLQKLFK